MSNVERPPSGERRWNRVVRGFSNLGWSEMATWRRGGGNCLRRGYGNKEGENKGEEWVRVVFVEEQRGGTWTKIGPVMEMRGPGGQWVSGPGPLNS